ncbi:uncharacterized protein Dere_GG26395 [Drosophila erecta]|nr:uncharacterized protein Dere_GG26395 [Drosophila erecta]
MLLAVQIGVGSTQIVVRMVVRGGCGLVDTVGTVVFGLVLVLLKLHARTVVPPARPPLIPLVPLVAARFGHRLLLGALLRAGYTISRSYPMRKPLKFWRIYDGRQRKITLCLW